ncbi:acetyl-CoA acetyltransferase [Paenibacillus sp. GCM10027628]|uniref:acetyl-CoA acetyltransferase n=1 Tax=Paenibacillus sp. GCM10027628 TaxID=3273413 RepID=UPI00363FD8D2
MYTNPTHHHVIYQEDPSWMPMLKQKRDQIWGSLKPHIGYTIRVTTLDGYTHEGVLVDVDAHHIYLQVSSHGHHHGGQYRPIYTPAAYNQIMTLVLFELLVIALLA